MKEGEEDWRERARRKYQDEKRQKVESHTARFLEYKETLRRSKFKYGAPEQPADAAQDASSQPECMDVPTSSGAEVLPPAQSAPLRSYAGSRANLHSNWAMAIGNLVRLSLICKGAISQQDQKQLVEREMRCQVLAAAEDASKILACDQCGSHELAVAGVEPGAGAGTFVGLRGKIIAEVPLIRWDILSTSAEAFECL